MDYALSYMVLRFIPRWVTPNRMTTFRFITIPFVVYLLVINRDMEGVLLFGISAFSDALDGARARVDNMITDWGKLYDPLADKLLIGSVAAVLVWQGYIYMWLALTIIAIEGLLISNGIYRRYLLSKVTQAVLPGKVKMILQSVALFLILFYIAFVPYAPLLHIATYMLYAAVFFALWSLVVYRSI